MTASGQLAPGWATRIAMALLALAATALLPASRVAAAEADGAVEATADGGSAQEGAADDAQGEDAQKPQPKYFDLGSFHVREYRPTRNEVADVKFSAQIELPAETDPATLAAVEHWRHRLRDQAIIAVRLSATVDFAEPHLDRLQRTMLRRINRTLPGLNAVGLYFSEFAAADP